MISTSMTNSHKDTPLDLSGLDPNATVPISLRVPIRTAYLLTLYAERMNTSTGKFMSSILEDVMPLFSHPTKDFVVKVRLPAVYQAMSAGDLLQSINPTDVKRRVLKRGEGQPIGRPRKKSKGAEG